MRLAYGVNGYGRGHAMRVRALLPELGRRHEWLLLAGADAYDALSTDYSVVRIPNLRYYYGRPGRVSVWQTLVRNAPMALDLWLGGAGVEMVADALRAYRPDVVLSDGEAYVLRAAERLGIPRITLDNVAQMAYCELDLRGYDRFDRWLNGLGYRLLLGVPDRIIIASFFSAPVSRDDIVQIGPIIRREAAEVAPTRGDYLLVYISKEGEYTPRVEQALLDAGVPARIYGAPRRGSLRHLLFKPLANRPFIDDLAGCRAVFGTTGNQLLGEVIYYGKPMLAMPIDCMEQRLNAIMLERLGMGRMIRPADVTGAAIRSFLEAESEFLARVPPRRRDGLAEAIGALDGCITELTADRRDARSDAGTAALGGAAA